MANLSYRCPMSTKYDKENLRSQSYPELDQQHYFST